VTNEYEACLNDLVLIVVVLISY